jgi:hypothetical protein
MTTSPLSICCSSSRSCRSQYLAHPARSKGNQAARRVRSNPEGFRAMPGRWQPTARARRRLPTPGTRRGARSFTGSSTARKSSMVRSSRRGQHEAAKALVGDASEEVLDERRLGGGPAAGRCAAGARVRQSRRWRDSRLQPSFFGTDTFFCTAADAFTRHFRNPPGVTEGGLLFWDTDAFTPQWPFGETLHTSALIA